jgi:predicted dehydrogenase
VEKLRWGFIGAGHIASRALYPAISKSNVSEIYAVASRDPHKAKTISPSGRIYTKYQDLLADPHVEAVYISLPNSLHIPLSIQALKAGKHVLCEKPLGLSSVEIREAITASEEVGKLFIEAAWHRWHPRTQRLIEIVQSGVLGELTRIRAAFTYDGLDDDSVYLNPAFGGGSLYDLGPYSTVAPLWITGSAQISDIEVQSVWHKNGVDETTRVNYLVNGVKAETLVSCNIPLSHWLIVEGSRGTLQTGGSDSFDSHNQVSTLELVLNGTTTTEHFAACDPYTLMSDAFAKRVRGSSDWLMPIEESLRNAEFLDIAFSIMGKPSI